MITLYQRTDCPFCWKVRLALAELAIDYTSVDTRLGEKHPEVVRLSPTGTVPVMVDEGLVLWDSAAILEYLNDNYASGRLLPADAPSRARLRLLCAYSDKVVGASLRDLVFEKRSRPRGDWDQEIIRNSENRWRECLAYLEEIIEEGGGVFNASFSIADCALASRFGVAEAYGAGVTEAFPGLLSWYRAMIERPGWQLAYPTAFPGCENTELQAGQPAPSTRSESAIPTERI